MDTQQKSRKVFWYSVRPNNRPLWLRKTEDHLDKFHKGVEVSPEEVYDYLRKLSSEILDYIHNLNPRVKIGIRLLQGQPSSLHIYRGNHLILLITL